MISPVATTSLRTEVSKVEEREGASTGTPPRLNDACKSTC